jgi:hypothetical protein
LGEEEEELKIEEVEDEEEDNQGDLMQKIGLNIMDNPFARRIHPSF